MILTGLVWGFLNTGGIGLVRLYQNYLSQDIPDKKYSWENFTDRGPREMLSGYYAGSDANGFYMWTISGLKKFFHLQGMSVYYFLDTCGIVKTLDEGNSGGHAGDGYVIEEEMYYNQDAWKAKMQKGDYVWVLRVGDGEDMKVIDKVWGNNNKTFPLDIITAQSCE